MNYDFSKMQFCEVCKTKTDHTFVFLDLHDNQVFYSCTCGVCESKLGNKAKSKVDTMSIERWVRGGNE